VIEAPLTECFGWLPLLAAIADRVYRGQRLAILAVQELAHRLPPSLVRFTRSLAFIGVHAALSYGDSWFAGAALRAAVTVPTKPLVGLMVLIVGTARKM
jgi:hypothetical protein